MTVTDAYGDGRSAYRLGLRIRGQDDIQWYTTTKAEMEFTNSQLIRKTHWQRAFPYTCLPQSQRSNDWIRAIK